MAAPHDHPRKETEQEGSKDHVDVQLRVDIELSPGVPRRLAGRVITIAVAAERKTEGEPTLGAPGQAAR